MIAKGQVQQQACRWCSETRLTTHGGAVELLGLPSQPGPEHWGTAGVCTCKRVHSLM